MTNRAPNCCLLTLLQFHENLLPAMQTHALRRKISEDPTTARLWQLVQRACQGPVTWPQLTACELPDAELVGAFIEQRLPADETAEFEQQCWRSAGLLHEVVSTFREFQSSKQSFAATSLSTNARLLALFPAAKTATDAGYNSPQRATSDRTPTRMAEPPPVSLDTTNGTAESQRATRNGSMPSTLAASPTISAKDRSSATISTLQRHQRARHSQWLVGLLTIGVLLVLAMMLAAISQQIGRPIADPTPAPSNHEDEDSPAPDSPPTADRIANHSDNNENQSPIDDAEHDTPPRQDTDLEPGLPSPRIVDQLELPDLPDLAAPRDEVIPDRYQPLASHNRIAMKWQQVEGLVAVRDAGQSIWRGVFFKITTRRSGRSSDSHFARQLGPHLNLPNLVNSSWPKTRSSRYPER